MDSESKLLLILEKVSEVSERTARMEVQTQKMGEDIDDIKAQDEVQNRLLDKHIQGTVANTERLNLEIKHREELTNRVEKLETAPQRMFRGIFRVLVYAGSTAAAIAEIARLFHKI